MKRLLAALLALAMVTALAGCSGKAPSGTITQLNPTEAPAETPTEAPTEATVSLGRMTGGVYENTYAGFACTLDESWTYYTAAELALLSPDETLGMFTLLSSDELKDKSLGFIKDNDRKAWGTEYATNNGLFVYSSSRGNHSPYWSRTQSTSNRQGARCIKSKGELGYINVITLDEGMRPACWLDMAKVVIASGEGTKENPYVLVTEAAPATGLAGVAEKLSGAAVTDDAPCCTPGECTCCASCACGCQD